MSTSRSAFVVGAVLLTGLVSVLAAAAPPRPGTEGNGLTENESATLWSGDNDSRYISNEAYREAYGENRTAIQQVANGTDLSFKRPPATAGIWTRHDFEDVTYGNRSVSIYPTDAELTDSVYIEDAHATIFAITPSTKGHLEDEAATWYVAPKGRVMGLVDYRVRPPQRVQTPNRTVTWSIGRSEIREVRLLQDGEVQETIDGTHTPNISYDVGGRDSTLTLEADIEVGVRRETIVRTPTNVTDQNGTVRTVMRSTREVTYLNDTVTVSDSAQVEIYNLTATLYETTYPDGTSGVAVFQNRPWQGYTLTSDGEQRVRGVWRFYTARDRSWDTLIQSDADGHERVPSDSLPVYVHAYPSELGPRAEPVRQGPDIVEVWGVERASPASSIGDGVAVEVVERPYESSYGVAVRSEALERSALSVQGIVYGENATIREPPQNDRTVRASNLSMEVMDADSEGATLRIELRDGETGEPIALDKPDGGRFTPIIEDPRSGYITVAGQRAETNASGVALVHVDESGVYTARYHPGSWLSHDPAYVGDVATARWHPLGTIEGWFTLALDVLLGSIPFVLAVFAGQKLGTLLRFGGEF